MSINRRKFIRYTSLAGTGFAFAACTQTPSSNSPSASSASSTPAGEALKTGFVYVGPVGDFGWTYAHDQGRKKMEENLQGRVTSTIVESVNEGADSERVIRQLATSGCKMIVGTAFGYMDPMLKVAKDFPDVAFLHCGGYKRAANVETFLGRFEEPRYLTGMIAGKMTKSNVIGYIGGFSIPQVVRGIGAFTLGLRETNPQASVKVIWLQSWYDPAKEREAALSLISQGVDVLSQNTDSTAIVQAAEEKGVYAFGYNSDMSKFGPKAQLTAAVHDWGPYYIKTAEAILAGNWKAGNVWAGMKDGVEDISPLNQAVPENVKKQVMAKRQEFVDGKALAFEGPIKDQTGTVRVAAGQALSDEDQLAMNWYVEGVQGQLPQ